MNAEFWGPHPLGPCTRQGPPRSTPPIGPATFIHRRQPTTPVAGILSKFRSISLGWSWESLKFGLEDIVARRSRYDAALSPMSDGWMKKKGYMPTTSRLGIWLRIEAVKRRVRRAE